MQLCTKVVHGKSGRHRTRLVLHGGVKWHFPAPKVDSEILVPYARKLFPAYGSRISCIWDKKYFRINLHLHPHNFHLHPHVRQLRKTSQWNYVLYLRFGLPFKTWSLVSILSKKIPVYGIVIEEYLIEIYDFNGKRSPASCIFVKTGFCQSNWPRYVWSVAEESTVVADDNKTVSSTETQLKYLFICLWNIKSVAWILFGLCSGQNSRKNMSKGQ